jgi:hypothetical protein
MNRIWTYEDEMNMEFYELCIRVLTNERAKIVRRGRLTLEEDIRLYQIDLEVDIYETLMNQMSYN